MFLKSVLSFFLKSFPLAVALVTPKSLFMSSPFGFSLFFLLHPSQGSIMWTL